MKQKTTIKFSLFIGLALFCFQLCAQSSIGEERFNVIKEAYTYDSSLPFNAIDKKVEEFPTYTRHLIYYSGAKETVSAFLAIPTKGEEPFPIILLIDGMGGSKERWFQPGNWPNGQETVSALIDNGFAVFTIDAAKHGERFDEQGLFPEPLLLRKEGLIHTVRDLIKLTVQDYMRGLDYLETLPELNTQQVGAYGLSMGATVTFILTGLDDRIKTAVAGVAVVYGNEYSLVNAYNFTHRINNTPFLMLMGSNDGFYTPKMATQLFNAIGGKKNRLIVFEGGHKVPARFIPIIANWFRSCWVKL